MALHAFLAALHATRILPCCSTGVLWLCMPPFAALNAAGGSSQLPPGYPASLCSLKAAGTSSQLPCAYPAALCSSKAAGSSSWLHLLSLCSTFNSCWITFGHQLSQFERQTSNNIHWVHAQQPTFESSSPSIDHKVYIVNSYWLNQLPPCKLINGCSGPQQPRPFLQQSTLVKLYNQGTVETCKPTRKISVTMPWKSML